VVAVLYPGPEVVITHEVFAVLGPVPQQFRIRELMDVRVIRGDLPRERMVLAHVAAGVLVVLLLVAPHLESALAWLIVTATAVSSLIISGAYVRLRPRIYELRVSYRGLDICLYSSPNLVTFGQVTRALSRALEGRAAGGV